MNPDDNQEQINQAVATLLATAPPSIQSFITGPDRERVTLILVERYHLDADQASELERAIIFLLLGVSNPQEFMSLLQNAGIDMSVVGAIAKDVNEEIFIPLSKQEVPVPQSTQNLNRSPSPIVPPMQVTMQTAPAMPPTTTPVQSLEPIQSSAPAQKLTQKQKNDELHQVLKSYGVDPYREPPE